MSKSLGNYVGITEPPGVMFGKLMQIADDLMYRYYELLTDIQTQDIERLRYDVAAGHRDPMEVKMDLASRIVTDFHSTGDADAAREAFTREVREGREPADTQTVDLPAAASSEKGIRVDKLITLVGLSSSVTEATRKIKAGAVEINGEISKDLVISKTPGTLVIRAGKQWKRVKVGADTSAE